MPTYDASNAECRVFTYKEGLLSAVAHDLEIDVARFEVQVADDASITASFDPTSLRVVDPIVGGRRSPDALGAKDRAKIEANIRSTVLHPERHPTIRFESTEVTETSIRGRLELHGRSRPITLRRSGDEAEVTLDQADFGIKPFTAMLGTMKIKPEVRVRLRLRARGEITPSHRGR